MPVDESIFPGRGAGDLEIESLKGAARPLDESPCRDVAESRLDEAVEVHIINDETAVAAALDREGPLLIEFGLDRGGSVSQ